MKKILIALSIVSITFASCNMNKKEPATNVEANSFANNEDNLVLPSDSGVIKIELIDGEGYIKTKKEKEQSITIEFSSVGYKKLSGELTSPDSVANIRFSQITMPDGTMDGPFGRDIQYDLPSDGIYKLSIHESLMAGDPWGGELNIHIKLLKQ